MLPPHTPTMYAVGAATIQQVGPVPAVVLAILATNDSGNGTMMSHRELAHRAGINRTAARRCIDKLSAAGRLKVEPQYQDFRQQANRYQIPTSARPVHHGQAGAQTEQGGDHREQPLSTTSTSTPTPSTSSLRNREEVLPTETSAAASLREPGGKPLSEPEACGEPGTVRVWPEPGSPLPVSSGGRKTLKEHYRQSNWLTAHFADYVLQRQNQERRAKGRRPAETIPEARLQRWSENAFAMVATHPLAEVTEVVDFVFGKCGGNLPLHLVDHENQRKRDRKVTRLQQVFDFYDELRAELASVHTEQPKPAAKPKVHYGQPLSDLAMEADVQKLVKKFGKFRFAVGDRNPDEFRTWGWAKTFRIALDTKTWTFAELFDVVAALKTCRHRMDVVRYDDAFHLMTEAELPQLRRMVVLAEHLAEEGPTDNGWGL